MIKDSIITIDLPIKGVFQASANGWCIKYYFHGWDKRFNPTIVYIHDYEIDSYIEAWLNNYAIFERLRNEFKNFHGCYSQEVDLGMTINIGGYANGVCLRGNNMPIDSLDDIFTIIKSYEWCKNVYKIIKQELISI